MHIRACTGRVSLSRIAASFHRFSPQTRPAPTRARHSAYKRPQKLFSPIVTFDSAALARDQRICFHPGPLRPSIPLPRYPPIVTVKSRHPRASSEISNLKFEIPPLQHAPRNSPAITRIRMAFVRAPAGAPGCSHWWSKAPRSKPSATSGQHQRENPTPAGVEESFECAQKSPKKRSAPTRARHKRWHDSPSPCVTICHLRFVAVHDPKSRIGGENDRREMA